MSKPPLSFTAPAVVNVGLHGQGQVTFGMKVTDSGSQPVIVHDYTARISPAVIAHPLGQGWHVTVSPASFTLRPGHSRVVRVHVTGASGTGVHAVNVVFAAQTAGTTGQAKMASAVASKVTFSGNGAATALPPPPVHPSAGPNPLALGGVAVAVVAIAAGLGVMWRRHRQLVKATRDPEGTILAEDALYYRTHPDDTAYLARVPLDPHRPGRHSRRM